MTQNSLPADFKFQRTKFELDWGNSPPIRARRGGVQVVNYADPYWTCTLKCPDSLTSAELLSIKGWFDSMEGGLTGTFLAHDDTKPYPAAYPNGFAGLFKQDDVTPFIGDATVSSVAARLLTITALPDNFQLNIGDYVSLVQSSRYSLHRITNNIVADLNGVAPGVGITPPVKTALFTTSADVKLFEPKAEFVPDPNSWDGEGFLRDAPGIGPSFSGVQRVA